MQSVRVLLLSFLASLSFASTSLAEAPAPVLIVAYHTSQGNSGCDPLDTSWVKHLLSFKIDLARAVCTQVHGTLQMSEILVEPRDRGEYGCAWKASTEVVCALN